MESISIRDCSVADIEAAPNLPELLSEYGAEAAIDGLGQPEAQLDTYHLMETLGVLHIVGAFKGDTLIGFLIMVVSTLPHYGVRIASTESFFVASAYRKTGAGLKLLHAAEDLAADMNASGFFVSAGIRSRLEQIMPAIGYRETNRIFFKALA